MGNCPYCSEEIQNDAIKCRFCGEFLEEEIEEIEGVDNKKYTNFYYLNIISEYSKGKIILEYSDFSFGLILLYLPNTLSKKYKFFHFALNILYIFILFFYIFTSIYLSIGYGYFFTGLLLLISGLALGGTNIKNMKSHYWFLPIILIGIYISFINSNYLYLYIFLFTLSIYILSYIGLINRNKAVNLSIINNEKSFNLLLDNGYLYIHPSIL